MGEHERRRVEGRVGAPPPSPVGVVLPARRTELPRTHDLGADPRLVLSRECIVGARAAPSTTTIGAPKRVVNIHSASRNPACPMGASALWPSPVAKPSSEMERL